MEGKISVYDSFRFGTKNIPTSFVFLFAEIWFSDWVRFFTSVLKNIPAFFRKISAGITTFRWKIVAVNLNSQQKSYDNGASAVLSRLTAVSAELLAILKK